MFVPTGPGVRVDTGVYSGFEVTPYYDSLISKLIVWGETRAEAILRMRRALEEYRIIGVKTNIPFHQALLELAALHGRAVRHALRRGSLRPRRRRRTGEDTIPRWRPSSPRWWNTSRRSARPRSMQPAPAGGLAAGSGSAAGADAPMKYITTIGERTYHVEIIDEHHVTLDGKPSKWISPPSATSRCIRC